MSEKKEKIDIILNPIKNNETVLQMKNYIQHGKVSTYEHCENVARVSYAINKNFRLHSDTKALLTAAMLHDFFLYDWHEKNHRGHGFNHAFKALENAKNTFNIDKKEEDIIKSHMWPLNITKIPHCREAWIVCFADKYCSLKETLFMRK